MSAPPPELFNFSSPPPVFSPPLPPSSSVVRHRRLDFFPSPFSPLANCRARRQREKRSSLQQKQGQNKTKQEKTKTREKNKEVEESEYFPPESFSYDDCEFQPRLDEFTFLNPPNASGVEEDLGIVMNGCRLEESIRTDRMPYIL